MHQHKKMTTTPHSNRDYKAPSYTDLRTKNFENHPFHCADCNKELQFKKLELRYPIRQYTEIMLQTNQKEPVCRECFANRIKKWFKTPQSEFRKHSYHPSARRRTECDACGKQKIVAHIIWEDFADCRFGIRSWNSTWICKDCLVKTVLHGRVVHSSGGTRINKQEFVRNEVGAMIQVDSTW